ncbi:MAG TPA: hypothetical protein DCQ31_05945 [Bacteroidales bacterium]|nr:hypothetical protein [Bacteroidales bacterium]
MDIEDFFENKSRHRNKRPMQHYYDGDSDRYRSHDSAYGRFNVLQFLQSLKTNKKLRILIIAVLIIVVSIVIGLVLILLPLLSGIVSYIYENGISGVVDEVLAFVTSLWEGAK